MKRSLAIALLVLLAALVAISYMAKRPKPKTPVIVLPEKISFFFTDPLRPENPSHCIDTILIRAIDASTRCIDAAIYGFDRTNILNAFLRAHQRGVIIRIVTEKDIYDNPRYRPTYQAMQEAGIPVKLDNNVSKYEYLMHNKFIVIDRHRVWTGSCNLTYAGFTYNGNDAVIIDSRDLAEAYTLEFEEMFLYNRWGGRKSDNNEELFSIGGKKVELYISPSDMVETQVIKKIDSARSSIFLAMFYLTNDHIYTAIKRAIERGVTVKAVLDERGASNNHSEALKLVRNENGVIDALSGLVHHKFCVIDKDGPDPVVITGSANWSRAGMNYNDDNTLIIHDRSAADAYFAQWRKLYDDATCLYPHSADISPPEPPRVTYHHYNRGPCHARIEWNTSQIAATSYNLYRSETPDGPYELVANISKEEALKSSDYQKAEEKDGMEGSYYAHYDDFDVSPGITYYYVLTTLVGDIESSYSNVYSEKIQPAPAAPNTFSLIWSTANQ